MKQSESGLWVEDIRRQGVSTPQHANSDQNTDEHQRVIARAGRDLRERVIDMRGRSRCNDLETVGRKVGAFFRPKCTAKQISTAIRSSFQWKFYTH